MKKVLFYILFIVLIFSLVGCGDITLNVPNDLGVTGTPTPTPTPGTGAYSFKIVFTSTRNNSSGGYNIFSMDIDGKNVKALTTSTDATSNYRPELSPDYTKVLYLKRTTTSLGIWVMDANGGGTTGGTLIHSFSHTTLQQWRIYASWTPDGKIIFFDNDAQAGLTFNIMEPVAGATPTSITVPTFNGQKPYNFSIPRVSPDGTKIIFDNFRTDNTGDEIYVANFNGSAITNPIKIYDGWFFDPYWSPDGTKIICSGREINNTTNKIFLINNLGSLNNINTVTQLTEFCNTSAPKYSPDGQKIIYASPSQPEASSEIYSIDKPDGSNQKNLNMTNLTNNAGFDGYGPWSII